MTPSPRQTADDLRSAALHVTTHGYTIGEYIDPSGRVCALGAIGLATGLFERVYDPAITQYDFKNTCLHSAQSRFAAAAEALAPLLPIACDDGRCHNNFPFTGGFSYVTTPEEHHELIAKDPAHVVAHFNDFICEGGDALSLLLTQAAEKIEADLP